MKKRHMMFAAGLLTLATAAAARGQAYGKPDRGEPGDEMIQAYLARQTQTIHDRFLDGVESREDWAKVRPQYVQEYYYMLGLDPMPPKTPLKATVTGTLRGNGYVVDMLHYQSRPRLYVTANLYRPADATEGERLPAVLYVCGHAGRGRNGNKTAYQSHGIWFARHGYVCLVLDSLQLGEIAAVHHGTYREGRWWWHARGYTPAGVECLNGIRGIDYLAGRPDVDPDRIAVTGISGGGAATFWIAAADERAAAAAPVSGMADLPSYVTNRVINGHCDCMFLYNTFQWPWTRIAALVAPRPLLFVNSDADRIFPMDANDRVINRLERVYSLYGAGDRVDAVVSMGGHAYREDIRKAAYRFINTWLKGDPREVADSEVDLVTGSGKNRTYPIDLERLRVFPEESDLPADELNTEIDRHFVPMARVEPPEAGGFDGWKAALIEELRRVTFRTFPERIGPAEPRGETGQGAMRIETEPGIVVPLRHVAGPTEAGKAKRFLLAVEGPGEASSEALARRVSRSGDAVYVLESRGVGATRWTRKNPPNYVERSHVLLGQTVATGRIRDVIAAARFLHARDGGEVPVHVAGEGGAGLLAAQAALWEPEIAGAILHRPPATHMDDAAPPLLNVLRVCDVPDVLGMLAPRPLTVHGPRGEAMEKVAAVYAAAGAADTFVCEPDGEATAAGREGFVRLFNGRDLAGWTGDPKIWSVRDGAITGQTTKEVRVKENTFLVWKDEVEDFELYATFRLEGGNSGIYYRAKEREPGAKGEALVGPQADVSADGRWTGEIMEYTLRGELARCGQEVTIDERGRRTVKPIADPQERLSEIDISEWNEYHVVARGGEVTLRINGTVMCRLHDHDPRRPVRGRLALQVHVGPPMRVQFKDLYLRRF
ncbi:MAG: family 16 glycoside hydrolase [Phycisphaerae bacterium]